MIRKLNSKCMQLRHALASTKQPIFSPLDEHETSMHFSLRFNQFICYYNSNFRNRAINKSNNARPAIAFPKLILLCSLAIELKFLIQFELFKFLVLIQQTLNSNLVFKLLIFVCFFSIMMREKRQSDLKHTSS